MTKPSLSLPMTTHNCEDCLELRSGLNNALLATLDKEGLCLWERRAKTRHVLSWEKLVEVYRQYYPTGQGDLQGERQ